MKERLTLKTILLFFLPLIFMSELIQLSHAITNAFLARLLAPKEIIAAFSIAFGLFYTPLNQWILGAVMGLIAELSGYCQNALRLTFLIAIFWASAATLRGTLSAMRKTFVIAVSAGVRLVVFAGIGIFAFLYPDLNGAVLGVIAFAGAFAAETILLGGYLWHQVRNHETLFGSLDAG